MSIHCGRSKEVLSPVWLYLQVTYCRVWKKTKETQIRADVESELTTKTNSPTTNAEPTRINILEEMSVQGRTLAKPHHGIRQGNTCVTFAQHLPPCLVNSIIFRHKRLPENGSLHHHLSLETQASSIFRAHTI